MQVWIGTSGYAYPDWVGGFYPPGTRANQMFAHYVRHFPLVELNYTFYRPPLPRDLANIARQAPAGFQFVVKLHQSLTHEQDLTGAAAFGEAVHVVKQEDRLLALLAQFPQRFHNDPVNLAYLESLAERFAGYPLAVEFRHQSWAAADVPEWLAQRGLHLVSVDVPDIPALYPRGLVPSGRFLYVRFHSRDGRAWYQGDKERYDYLYSDEELQEWLQWLTDQQAQADRALLLFNNCRRSQAAENARRMAELLRLLGLSWEIVPALAPAPEDRQGLLF